MNKRVCKADQIKLIMKCRRNGLSDYQWCEQNGIHAGTFYNWVSKLRKNGYTVPESQSRTNNIPIVQDIVKVDLMDYDRASSPILEAIPKGHEKDYNNPAVQGVLYCNKLFEYERSYKEKRLSFKQIHN